MQCVHQQLRQNHPRNVDGSYATEYPCYLCRADNGSRRSRCKQVDLIDAMVVAADDNVSDEHVAKIESAACPTCGSCSGMFTANSMNCLNEAIGLALPGNGTIVATHANRKQLFVDAAKLIVENTYKYYRDGDESVLPRSIATREAFINAMALDVAMGGSTNTVLILALPKKQKLILRWMILMLFRKIPNICK